MFWMFCMLEFWPPTFGMLRCDKLLGGGSASLNWQSLARQSRQHYCACCSEITAVDLLETDCSEPV
ncbi:hypothetical protein LguiA_016878 [Lonicera macranthoides]